MLRNFFTIAIRNLFKRKYYAAVNVLGLALGIAICLLIIVFIRGELGYDSFIPGAENIYRVVVDRKYPERLSSYSNIPQSYAGAMQMEFPEVEHTARVYDFSNGVGLPLRYNGQVYEGKQCYMVDSSFFDVFPYPFLFGNPKTALINHGSLVITESTARAFFGDPAQAIGKQMTIAEQRNDLVEVTGVITDWPEHSHMKFEMLYTTAGLDFTKEINYVNFGPHTYVKLTEGTISGSIEKKFPGLINKYAVTNIEQGFGISFAEFQKGGNGYRYFLQNLPDIYLDSHLEGELRDNGSRQAIMIFSLIAVVIFIIACINFVNLATARSAERAREVGLRKTFGSNKTMLIGQFLVESVTISLLASIIALGLAALLMDVFGKVTDRSLQVSDLFNPVLLLTLLGLSFITGFLAGIYPAFVLSAFRPIEVLKGNFKSGNADMLLRNGLVVFQFSISVVLIICTIVVNRQMQFMTGDDLGFKQDQVIVLERSDLLGDKKEAWRTELKKIPGVMEVSYSSGVPGTSNYFGLSWQTPESREPMTGRGMFSDEEYIETLGLQLLEGRYFSKDFATDSLAVVINERAALELGLKDPLGKELVSGEGFLNGQDGTKYKYTVIGVVKDFHYQSLHQPVNPLVINNLSKASGMGYLCAIKVGAGKTSDIIASIEKTWKKMVPEKTMNFHFLDQTIQQQYHGEMTTKRLFTLFASLAIFIACIGLLGLAAYSTQLRLREIGIRKVLGASVMSISQMLTRDFLKLVLLATLPAFPVAWFIMHSWLQDFSYRIDIAPWIFIAAMLISIFIALLTISFQIIRAAFSSPVNILRTE